MDLKLRSGVRQPTGVTVYSLSELLENLLANIGLALVDSQWWRVIHHEALQNICTKQEIKSSAFEFETCAHIGTPQMLQCSHAIFCRNPAAERALREENVSQPTLVNDHLRICVLQIQSQIQSDPVTDPVIDPVADPIRSSQIQSVRQPVSQPADVYISRGSSQQPRQRQQAQISGACFPQSPSRPNLWQPEIPCGASPPHGIPRLGKLLLVPPPRIQHVYS